MNLSLDFTEIGDEEDFFSVLKENKIVSQNFEENVISLTAFLLEKKEQLEWEFYNLNVEQLETFESLITTLEDIEEQNEHFSFKYYLEQFDTE